MTVHEPPATRSTTVPGTGPIGIWSIRRFNWRRMTTCPLASTPWARKTDFAISRPIVAAIFLWRTSRDWFCRRGRTRCGDRGFRSPDHGGAAGAGGDHHPLVPQGRMSPGISRPPYEAANVLMTRVQRRSPLKAWCQRLSKRLGAKTAKIAKRASGKSVGFWTKIGDQNEK